jgi:hypothetical protein
MIQRLEGCFYFKSYPACCTRWAAFAQHLQQTYPDMPRAAELTNFCAAGGVLEGKQDKLLNWMVEPTGTW